MRRKKYKSKKSFVIFIFVLILTTGIGYSIFSEAINITGTGTLAYLIQGNQLDLTLYQTGGRYAVGNPPVSNFVSETLNANEIVLTFSRANSGGAAYSTQFVITFENKYPADLINGSVSSSIISGSSVISASSSNISNTTLTQYQGGTLTYNITKTNKDAVEVLTTMQYDVDGYGLTQYFYFRLIFT